MIARTPINPGSIDWTGENPGIYLKNALDGPYTCLASFFRVFYSPHGSGHSLFLLWDPQKEHPFNAIYTDNERLSEWLRDNFVARFAAFRGNLILPSLPVRRAGSYGRGGDPRSEYSEVIGSQSEEIRLTWRGLTEPYYLQMPPANSATGVHELFSVFLDARDAEVVVNGERGLGSVYPRDFFGRQGSNAFLAFSETWVGPGRP